MSYLFSVNYLLSRLITSVGGERADYCAINYS